MNLSSSMVKWLHDHSLDSWRQSFQIQREACGIAEIDLERSMKKQRICLLVLATLLVVFVAAARKQARGQARQPAYPAMAPKNQYLMPDKDSEIALARSAAPASISGGAEVQVLGPDGYTIAATGGNGFVCLVERGFAAATDDPVFWNPNIRGAICVNAPAARSYLPAVQLKARLALQGKSKAEIAEEVKSAMDSKQLPALEPNAMSYMMSKQQYLDDKAKNWHPHIMLFVAGDQTKSWGADRPDSPVMAGYDSDDRMTTFFFWVENWSDGSPAPHDMH
jgi:hypothetical protein